MIVLFGEAEKGEYATPLLFKSVLKLAETLGNPPEESKAIPFAIQTLLYQRDLLFIRVREEGFSRKDYFRGLKSLKKCKMKLAAIFLPGVGDLEILEKSHALCLAHNSLLITTEKDLYDFFTSSR